MTDPVVVLADTSKVYGTTTAVREVSFELSPKEFLVLLGPSGSGKSTILRLIAGFADPTSGTIHVRGRPVAGFPPHRRDIGVVFQHLALFPHLSVFHNVAFGLQMRKVGRADITDRVQRMLDLVRLGGLEKRLPKELSGGQQQRVALARALVIEPDVLLLDEPLGSLDRHLRSEMQVEIKRLQRTLGIATIMVTHDQEEAITLGDRIAVLRDGQLEQIGTPASIYHSPSTLFIAEFMGAANLFRGLTVERAGENAVCKAADGLTLRAAGQEGLRPGDVVDAVVRPETIALSRGSVAADNCFEAEIVEVQFGGAVTRYVIAIGGVRLTSLIQDHGDAASLAAGDHVFAAWSSRAVTIVMRA